MSRFLATLCRLHKPLVSSYSPGITRFTCINKIPNNFYCSGSSLAVEDPSDSDGLEGNVSSSTTPLPEPEVSNIENITKRLLRLSMQSPEDYVSSEPLDVIEQKRRKRYRNYFPDQSSRSYQPNTFRSGGFSNPNQGHNNSFYRNPNDRRTSFRSSEDDEYEHNRSWKPNYANRRNSYQDDDEYDAGPQRFYPPRYNRNSGHDSEGYEQRNYQEKSIFERRSPNVNSRFVQQNSIHDMDDFQNFPAPRGNKNRVQYDDDNDIDDLPERSNRRSLTVDEDGNRAAIKEAYLKRKKDERSKYSDFE